MRRLLVIGLALVLSSLILASAADLDVSGGTFQVLRYDVEVTVPTPSPQVGTSSIPAAIPISKPVPGVTP